MSEQTVTDFFWRVAEIQLRDESVSKGTMMGFPCLRVNGDFYASADYRTGDLVIKLPAERVSALIDAGEGDAFAPNGRRFREWVAITERDAERWETLIDEARLFVETKSK
ncbi:MAG: hypothetical protein AAF702_47625 [Chloroflexota bacterium]